MSFYDAISPIYDALSDRSERQLRQLGLVLLAVREGERALEVGTGTGLGCLKLTQAVGTTGLACGVDLSERMLRKAKNRLARAAPGGRHLLIRANGLALPFMAATFDLAFLSFTLELFEEDQRSALLREINRVTHASARLAVVSLAEGKGGTAEKAYGWLHRKFPQWIDCRPIPVERELAYHGWRIGLAAQTQLWGIPVSITMANKSSKPNH